MKREIKFRAWDKEGKQMVELTTNLKALMLNDAFDVLQKRYKLMQFTGLKDKNGKDVYEGDVFKNVLDTVRVVAFDDGGFKLVKDRFFKTVAGDMHSLGDMNKLEADNGEVIGNIYENPDLLTSNKE